MDPLLAVVSAVGGYLLGSISFARVINRFVAPGTQMDGMDMSLPNSEETAHFDGISGTAVSVKLGAKWGGITSVLDILKVAIPTLVLRLVFRGMPYYLLVAAGGLVGHVWPAYYRFRGGRGLSPIYGGFLVLDFVGSLVTAVAGMFFSIVVLRNLIISYMAGLWLMIPWVWFRTHDLAQLTYVVFANIMFVVAMIPDLKRVLALRRSGVNPSMEEIMESMPMTRMIKKMSSRVRLFRDRE
jgi:glycerol-3-phosphate acyltransferase PlsY